MTKTLRDSKNHLWPTFPLQCGAFTLHDFKHVEKEAEKIKLLKLATILKRKYNPRSVGYNVTAQAKITKFYHEKDNFDDLFVSTEVFSQVKHLAKIKLGAEGLEEFYKLRAHRLETLSLDLLNTTFMVQPQGHSEETITEKTLEIEKIPRKAKTPERE